MWDGVSVLQLAAGGGFAVMVAAFLLRFFVEHVKRLERLVSNHLEHNTAALTDVANALKALTVELREERRNAKVKAWDAGRDPD